MNTRDFLFELGTEELPRLLARLERALTEGFATGWLPRSAARRARLLCRATTTRHPSARPR